MSSQPRAQGKAPRRFELVAAEDWPRSNWLPLMQAIDFLVKEPIGTRVKLPLDGRDFERTRKTAHEYSRRAGIVIRTAAEPEFIFLCKWRSERSTRNK